MYMDIDDYDVMVCFIKQLDNYNAVEALFDVIEGKGAFKGFRNTLKKYPVLEDEWYAFKDEKNLKNKGVVMGDRY